MWVEGGAGSNPDQHFYSKVMWDASTEAWTTDDGSLTGTQQMSVGLPMLGRPGTFASTTIDNNAEWAEITGFRSTIIGSRTAMDVVETGDGLKLIMAGGVSNYSTQNDNVLTVFDLDDNGNVQFDSDGHALRTTYNLDTGIKTDGSNTQIGTFVTNGVNDAYYLMENIEVDPTNGNIVLLGGSHVSSQGVGGIFVLDAAGDTVVHADQGGVGNLSNNTNNLGWIDEGANVVWEDGKIYITSSGTWTHGAPYTIILDSSDYSIIDQGFDTSSFSGNDSRSNEYVSLTTVNGENFIIEREGGSASDSTGDADLRVAESPFGTGLVVPTAPPSNYIVDGTAGDDLIDASYSGDPEGDKIDNDDGNPNSPGIGDDDSVVANDGNDTVISAAGNDTVRGGAGDDSLLGGDGEDSLVGGAGADYIDGGLDDDTLDGGSGDDTLLSGFGDDSVLAGDGDDSVNAGPGADTVHGGAGNDTIDGNSGDDSIRADEGDDLVYGGDGNDTIYGFEGSDTVLGGAGSDLINTRTSPGTGTPDQGLTYPDDPSTTVNETLIYSYPADVAGAPNGAGGTFGGPDDDRDSVEGGAGNDTILTGDDDDTIYGGSGADVIDAGFDDDTVDGGLGADSIQGSEGNDTIDGGGDDDIIYGGVSPSDPNYATAQLYDLEDAGSNTPADPNVGNNADLLRGGAGDDQIFGQDDADTLLGGTGQDTLDGGIDDDQLNGGEGSDVLTGGQGDDVFVVSSGNDTITDFGSGETGPIDDGDQSNNDFVDLSGYYSWPNYNAAVAAGDIDPMVIKTPLQWARADLQDDGVLNDSAAGWSASDTLALTLGGSAVDPLGMTFDTVNVVCFARGTQIKTLGGEMKVEDLAEGMQVLTLDAGYQPIRWIGARKFSFEELKTHENIRPIRIRAGALGRDMPEADLLASPQHRVLVNAPVVARMFNRYEVLVAAKQLLSLEGIEVADDIEEVEYWHFLLDAHQVVFSNGARTETMFTGPEALKSVSDEARAEIFTIFPELEEQGEAVCHPPARMMASGRRGRQLAVRLAKNKSAPTI